MKTTISSFARLVERDYGSQIAATFTKRFSNSIQEVGFSQAMDVLDEILGAGSPSGLLPRSPATNSFPGEVSVKMTD
jgi:hypothetical protein